MAAVSIFSDVSVAAVAATVFFAAIIVSTLLPKPQGSAVGPRFFVPFIGSLLSLVVWPVQFWEKQAAYSRSGNGISMNRLLGRMIFYVADWDLVKKVFNDNTNYEVWVHPNAHYLIGNELMGDDKVRHKLFRSLLLPCISTPAAVRTFRAVQERTVIKAFDEIAAKCKISCGPYDILGDLRFMTARISQDAMMGPYMGTPEEQKTLVDRFMELNQGFLAFPLPIPGTTLHTAIKARKAIMSMMAPMVAASRKRMEAKEEPACLMDFVHRELIKKEELAAKKGVEDDSVPTVADVIVPTPENIASLMLSCLFAAQDATTSAVAWALEVMDSHPEMWGRVRAEIDNAWREAEAESGATAKGSLAVAGENVSIAAIFDKLTFLRDLTSEIMRVRPPVPMVPHLSASDTTLAGVNIPKGAMVVPSIYHSRSGAADEPGAERQFSPDAPKDPQFKQSLVFGSGAHLCPGRYYAIQLVAVFVGAIASRYDVRRVKGPKSNGYMFMPTLFPADSVYDIQRRQLS
eukprot:jgi/Mesvir1/1174/Mv17671-RA.1